MPPPKRIVTPFSLPIYAFGLAVALGSLALSHPACLTDGYIRPIDAVFTATSAVCVTGLIVVDTGSFFTPLGQTVILALIQLGGLGIMTYTSLALILLRRRVSMTDRLAVGQSLLHDPAFDLRRFLYLVVTGSLALEAMGCLALWALDPHGFNIFSAAFHSISAFCNAGFALQADSLMPWHDNIPVNLVFMVLITIGGLGFTVVNELVHKTIDTARGAKVRRLSFHTRIVLTTSAMLVVAGTGAIFLGEVFGSAVRDASIWERLLHALFQSVTSRTAGFNTVEIGAMSNVALVFMMMLMYVGGSPGSTAGGTKTTTARAVVGFVVSQIKGRPQTVVGNRALDQETMNKAITLTIVAGLTVAVATLVLSITEAHLGAEGLHRGNFIELFFEVVSAFGTVGLSTGVTPKLSDTGRAIIITLIFVGRLGPILFLTALQEWQTKPHYAWAKEGLMIG
ncbi:MAG: TrkH family potassium uptake protein [Oceanidesulfovibrio sp.]